MVRNETRWADIAPYIFIEALIEQHGRWHVLREVIRAALRRDMTVWVCPEDLTDHLRRDIGLVERTDSPQPPALPERIGPLI